MQSIKKIFVVIISYILFLTLIGSVSNNQEQTPTPIKVAVFLSRANDIYISQVAKSLEDIQKENEGKVEFTFFDGKGNQVIQNESIDKALNEDFDLFIINLVDVKSEAIKSILGQIARKNIPFIIDGTPSQDIINTIQQYRNTIFIGTDLKQSGTLEGKIIADAWRADKKNVDKNNDDVLQYIMLQGQPNSPGAIDRTKYSVQAINETGIKTEQLALQVCSWEEDCAKTSIEALFLRYGNKIEAIIANNDAMAIGAIEALQRYGYNKGDKSKNILVVGVDAVPKAKELVNEGLMTGTVIQDPRAEAEALYSIGMNLAKGQNPLEGTNYKLDSNKVLLIPYKEYTKQ